MGAPRGNRNGAKAKEWEGAIRKALAQHAKPEVLREIADVLVEKALAGDQFAITEIANRLDGKPAQAMTVSGVFETIRRATDLDDDALAHIAAGGSAGAFDTAEGQESLN